MKTIEIKGWLYAKQGWDGKTEFTFFDFEVGADSDWIQICPHIAHIEMPEDFDIRSAEITSLEKKLEKVRAAFMATQTEILDRISKLQALTFDPA
ncbi:hypothetical protein LMG18090_04731 [Ralstonia mannitolilytica]|uniref:Uncharacterized protein n=1 Tax=Ralstonia mannitolilytica TaxID=105219 RepID=A0ABM9KZR9_9RALS|nr:hypothetical protein [Ralstonia mannitolilytica]ANA34455.1 hypothetical protein VZ52_14215 [Ralstonia mannitolilytica]CAJ0805084.1 hypothetical protein LMG18090_04731 [Ralstonia mannitolilytica]CAJ0894060.1 hypothetical protein R77569_04366 [Ralstonia mannitolilytica]